jgi:hypothetical protein
MNKIESRGHKLLIEQWNSIKADFEKLRLPAALPNDGYQIFSLSTAIPEEGKICFEVNPVAFNVPERANETPNIYIVARGRIYLDTEALNTESVLRTVNFATEVGYFRKSGGALNHIYGAHYDFSGNEIGHPVFHAQMKSYNDRSPLITELFELDCLSNDLIKDVFRTVRVPTAQMDFFSVILQICADHLMSKDSGDEDKRVFEGMRSTTRAIQGAGHLWAKLVDAPPCMRSVHWYN